MARVSNPDEENVDPNAPAAAPEPVPGAVADASGAAQAPAQPKRARFNDLSRLLYANQGQGAKMAQGAIAKADQGAADVNSRLGAAQAQYQQTARAAVPKAVAPVAPPPVVVAGSGGLTGRGTPTMPTLTGDMRTDILNLQSSGMPVPGTPRTTTQINTAADLGPAQIAQAQQLAGASYKGPHSLADSLGVGGISNLQQSLDQVGQQYSTLGQNPSHQTGGAGRFNDFLIGAEGQPQIQAAQQRFAGLRGRFNTALGDTSAGDNAAAATSKIAADAKALLDKNAADAAAATTQQQTADNAAKSAAQTEDDYFSAYRQGNPTLSDADARKFYDANKAHIHEVIDNLRRANAGG